MVRDEISVNPTPPEVASYRATDRLTWRRLVDEKCERIHAFERHVMPGLMAGLGYEARCLEIGCGLGWASAVMASACPDVRMTATDIVAPYLSDHARALISFFGVRIVLTAADAAALPFPSGSFDRVFSQHVLYRVSSPLRAIREAVRVLAPGGRWLALESAAPWCQPWLGRSRRHFARRNEKTGLREIARTEEEWLELFRMAHVRPVSLAWATRKGYAVRYMTNAVRSEHVIVTVEKP